MTATDLLLAAAFALLALLGACLLYRDHLLVRLDCYLRPDLRGRREYGAKAAAGNGRVVVVSLLVPEAEPEEPPKALLAEVLYAARVLADRVKDR